MNIQARVDSASAPLTADSQSAAIRSICESIDAHRLIVVIGTGVSLGLTDCAFPHLSWRGLVEHGFAYAVKKQRITSSQLGHWSAQLNSGDIDELLAAAEFVGRKLDAPEGNLYARWLGDAFSQPVATNNALKDAIVELHKHRVPICTLNFDSLLEDVLGVPAIVMSDIEETARWMRGAGDGVLHLHGFWKKPATCVLGIRDYASILKDEVRDLVQRSMASFNRLLFLGCHGTFSDPNHSALIGWLRRLNAAMPQHYVLVRNVDVDTGHGNAAWQGFVEPLGYGVENAELAPFLLQLLQRSASPNSRAPSTDVSLSAGTDSRAFAFSPPRLHGFSGRAFELGRLNEFMSTGLAVIVIEGLGGVGKTALAAHFVMNTPGRHDAFWFECRRDTSFDELARALASLALEHNNAVLLRALENVAVSLDERLSLIATALDARQVLIVLDDYHLVVDPFIHRFVSEVARKTSQVKLILVARERPPVTRSLGALSVAELAIREGLELPACADFLAARGLATSPELVRRIWETTGEGHPKALEILVARARSIPLADLLRTLPVFREELRQQWLGPLIDDLPAAQRDLAVKLSVFDRPLSPDDVSGLFPDASVWSHVTGLVDRFVLDWVEADRIRMHQLVRDYCYSLLEAPASTHAWAAEYFLSRGGDDAAIDAISEAEIDARLTAWSHLLASGDTAGAMTQLERLRRPLMNRGQYEQLMFLIDQTGLASEDDNHFRIDRARILSLWGDLPAAVEELERLAQSTEGRVAREALLVLAGAYIDHGYGDRARELLESHHKRFAKAPTLTRRRFLSRLVEAHSLLGEPEEALGRAKTLLQVCQQQNDEIGGATAMRQMAGVLRRQGDFPLALQLAQESRSLLESRGKAREAAISTMLVARVHEDLANIPSAKEQLERALRAFVSMHDLVNTAECRRRLDALNGSV